MENIERAVAQHYGVTDLLERIFKGLEAAGTDLNCLQPEDLAPVDEYHIGGREATAHAIDKMSLSEDQHVLDIGCGIGGTARYMAEKIGCKVTGIDLTPEYISIAKTLTDLTGLGSKVTYKVASALNMPSFWRAMARVASPLTKRSVVTLGASCISARMLRTAWVIRSMRANVCSISGSISVSEITVG